MAALEGGTQMQVITLCAPVAASLQKEILADFYLRAALVKGSRVGRETVLISDVSAEGTAQLRLILASFCEADLTLEEEILTPFLTAPTLAGLHNPKPRYLQGLSMHSIQLRPSTHYLLDYK